MTQPHIKRKMRNNTQLRNNNKLMLFAHKFSFHTSDQRSELTVPSPCHQSQGSFSLSWAPIRLFYLGTAIPHEERFGPVLAWKYWEVCFTTSCVVSYPGEVKVIRTSKWNTVQKTLGCGVQTFLNDVIQPSVESWEWTTTAHMNERTIPLFDQFEISLPSPLARKEVTWLA